jgi:hypothetical protein
MNSELKSFESEMDESGTVSDNLELGVPSESKPACAHNFNGDPLEQWRLSSAATSVECKAGSEIVDQVFGLKNWFCHKVTISNDGGSNVDTVRTVLMDSAGNAYGFVSQGVYKSLRIMISHMGTNEFDPPIPIVVKSSKRAGGRKYYSIEPAPKAYEEVE